MRKTSKRMEWRVSSLLITPLISIALGVSGASAAVCDPPVAMHRGGVHTGITEQTIPNYQAARADGSRLFEGDIRFGAGTANPTPVLMHASTLSLFGCSESVSTVTYTWMAANCQSSTGQVPATLTQFLNYMKSVGGKAWLELKVVPTEVQWNALESRLSKYKSRVVIQSFTASTITEADARGYVTAYLSSVPVAVTDLPDGTQWYAPAYGTLTEAQADAMHEAGVSVAAWTPDPNVWSSLPEGVDLIISNYLVQPAPLSKIKKKK